MSNFHIPYYAYAYIYWTYYVLGIVFSIFFPVFFIFLFEMFLIKMPRIYRQGRLEYVFVQIRLIQGKSKVKTNFVFLIQKPCMYVIVLIREAYFFPFYSRYF